MTKSTEFRASDFYMMRTSLLSLDFYKDVFNQNSSEKEQYDKLLEFIGSDIVNEAIAVSSSSLKDAMNRLKNRLKNNLQFDSRDKKTLQSLMKYLIRMSSRTTPFGIFSGVMTGRFSETSSVVISSINKHKKRARVDMAWLYGVLKSIENTEEMLYEMRVRFNDLNYKNGTRLENPYISNLGHFYKDDNIDNATSSIRYTNQVQYVEKICKRFIKYSSLLENICNNNPHVEHPIIARFIKQLFDNEYLISELRPATINNSPLDYLIDTLKDKSTTKDIYMKLIDIKNRINDYNNTSVGKGLIIYQDICNLMKNLYECENYLQVDLKLESNKNVLSKNVSDELEKIMRLLIKLAPPNIVEPSHIADYKNDFIKKYGKYAEVPVMELLDTDIGLGAPAGYKNPISRRVYNSNKESENYKQYKKIINNKIINAIRDNQSEIYLTDSDIRAINRNTKDINENLLPISLEINAFISAKTERDIDNGDFRVIIGPNYGSHYAGKMFGRFTDMLSKDIACKIEDIYYKQKQWLGDEYIFAEVFELFQIGRTGNIVLNKNCTENQISIATNYCGEKKVISIKDLYIGIDRKRNDIFYIKSKKLNKKIIITSNHMLTYRGGSNIYRFLREITSFRGIDIISSLVNLEVKNELEYRPRLVYGKTVLVPRGWMLSKDIMNVSYDNEEIFRKEFKKWSQKWSVPRYVYLVDKDNRLLLDLENIMHVFELFHTYKKSDKPVVLQEIESELDDVWSKNHKKEKFLAEIVVPFYINKEKNNTKLIKLNHLKTMSDISKNINQISMWDNRRVLLPFSYNWIYFKLYGISKRVEELIGFNILPYCQKLKNTKLIDKYFFIRYADPDEHIRLRIKISNGIDISKVIIDINKWLNTLKDDGLLSSVQIDTYIREIERYGGIALIENAEDLFHYDSEYVAELIKAKREGKMMLKDEYIGIVSVIYMLSSFGLNIEAQENLLSAMIDKNKYREDFREDRKNYTKMAYGYENWMYLRKFESGEEVYKLLDKKKRALTQYIDKINNADNKESLTNSKINILRSLIHMFFNRFKGDNNWEAKVMALTRHSVYALKNSLKNQATLKI
ncbi:lantibiotic dehydratase [Clostridiaceae bacterium M8S5]|nr:lantibiotic dehydratase [Clostridiaceae bacterium M8S5]